MARLRAVRLAAELTIAAAAAAVGWAGPERYGVVEQVAGADRAYSSSPSTSRPLLMACSAACSAARVMRS